MSVADYSTPALQLPTPTGPASPSAHSPADPLNPLPVLPHIDPSLPVRPHLPPYPTAQNAELMKDLRLAELQIQRLELEAESAKRMLDQERLLRARLNEIDEEAKSIASEPLALPTDYPDQRMKAVGAYVASIPKNPPSVSFPGPYVRPTPPTDDVSRLAETAQLLRACMNTPVRQAPKFDGNPRHYHGFIRGFASAVERYLTDPTDLLAHLIECCQGEAADAIRRCTILDPRVGYTEARRILERRFGEPHVIARQCIEELTGGPPLKPNDCQALVKLADSMKLCSATLKHLCYEADLNATKTLRSIVQRLPGNLQTRWCDVAAHIFKEGREPMFDELADFVDDRADAATTRQVYLGEDTHEIRHSERVGFHTSNRIPQSKPGLPTQKVCTLATTSNNKSAGSVRATTSRPYPVCPKCGQLHYLDQCQEFLKLSTKNRAQFAKTSALCELCLKPNHRPDTCKSWRRCCTFEQCREQHHPLLHCGELPWAPDDTTASADSDPHKVAINTSTTELSPVALGVLPVRIRGPLGCCTTLALLDSGSDSTLIEAQLAARLGLVGNQSTISIGTLHGRTSVASRRVQLELVTQSSTATVERLRAWSVPKLPTVHQVQPSSNEVNEWPHLAKIPFQPLQGHRVELLIGMDNPSMHWVLESKVGKPMEPYAVRTPLGWVLLGPLRLGPVSAVRINNTSCGAEELVEKWDTLCQMEFGDLSTCRKGNSRDDCTALAAIQDSIIYKDGHYEVPLPWRHGRPILPSNRSVVQSRLRQLASKLGKDSQLHRMYTDTVEDYIGREYAEAVTVSDNVAQSAAWYLPHHPVYHPQKPHKVRVVFDCASQFQGQSLNDQLLAGPDIVNSLFGVLLRFRQAPYVFAADIEAMFHQVKLPEADRRYLRFLWWDKGNILRPPTEYQMTVHPFGAKSSPFCASFALQKTLKDNRHLFDNSDPTPAERAFYVDDCLYSSDSEQELIRFANQLNGAVKAGGFRLLKWSSNVQAIFDNVQPKERAETALHLDLQPTSIKRMLGVQWDMTNDVFQVKVDRVVEVPTRRSILSFIAAIYDPIGFTSPAVLPGRLLLQQLCRIRLGWDDALAEEYVKSWRAWTSSLETMMLLKIPRCLLNIGRQDATLELHCFSDASEKAYGAVIYLRVASHQGTIECGFICGKSRVAPVKAVTIPRLELTAAVLAARLASQVKDESSLPFSSVTFWTDSMIVLQAIRNTTTRFQVFVANRLTAIHNLSNVNQWRYVDSRQNPADLASRGLDPCRLEGSSWLTGPEFLRHTDRWPAEPTSQDPDNTAICLTLSVTKNPDQPSWFDNYRRFGSWPQLQRAVAWLQRFCEYIRRRRTFPDIKRQLLTCHELDSASLAIIRLVQHSVYFDELKLLQSSSHENAHRQLRSTASPIRQLQPFVHEGILRVGGRLKWALLPFEAKHPAILPRRHFVTTLIIRHKHETLGHVGASQVLASLRERYWIVQGHAAVKSVLSSCFQCRRWHAKPCHQLMAPLPVDRTESTSRPFNYVGVDCFGPLQVKRGRSVEKRYGCLFTCLTVRAVHIEVLHTLETDSFLCAFSRFSARRGSPARLYSDNGTNFRGAETDLKSCIQSWNQERIGKRLSEHGCDWIFSSPRASHQGGVWERLIRSVRRILCSLLGDNLVGDETLQTILTEVEKIMNDRPLVKVTADPLDFAALTPNQLLLLFRNPATQPEEVTNLSLTKRWRKANFLADLFWARWQKEYLPTLQTCYRWLKRGKNIKVGDLVLLVDYNSRRSHWSKGVILETLTSKDGAVRRVQVRTPAGILHRDIRQLCLLEAHEDDPTSEAVDS